VDVAQARAASLRDYARRPGLLVLVELGERVEDEPPVEVFDCGGVDGLGLCGYDGLLALQGGCSCRG
jgi:hypothetical protein